MIDCAVKIDQKKLRVNPAERHHSGNSADQFDQVQGSEKCDMCPTVRPGQVGWTQLLAAQGRD